MVKPTSVKQAIIFCLGLVACSCASVSESPVVEFEPGPGEAWLPSVPQPDHRPRARNDFVFEGSPLTGFISEPVPPEIVRAAWEFLGDKAGEDFCQSYVVYDSLESRRVVPPEDASRAPWSRIRFHLRSLEEPLIKGEINFSLDDSGELLEEQNSWGIPQCDERIGGCDLEVSSEQAKELACSAGLDPGIGGYSVEFHFSGTHQRYYWIVTATYERTETYERGQVATVNTQSGSVSYSRGDYWERMHPARDDSRVVPN